MPDEFGYQVDLRGDRRDSRTRSQILDRVAGEFREMAGLTLTTEQAQRLFQLEPGSCHRILDTLVDEGVLRRTGDGAYARSDLAGE